MTSPENEATTIRPALFWTAGLFGLAILLILLRLIFHQGFSDNGHMGRYPLPHSEASASKSPSRNP